VPPTGDWAVPGEAVPLRAADALIGPDGRVVGWTRIGGARGVAGCPTAFWSCDRRLEHHVEAAVKVGL
jgi:hypothetical protein